MDGWIGDIYNSISNNERNLNLLNDKLLKVVEDMKSDTQSNACNDFPLSDPPTLEELTEINKMQVGSFYTINGGNVMMVFRKPFALPLVKSPPAEAPPA